MRVGGRLVLREGYSRGDVEGDVLKFVPTIGDTVAMVDAAGGIDDIGFLSGNAGPEYSVAALPLGSIHDVYMVMPPGGSVPVLGLSAWSMSRCYGAGAYGGVYGNYPAPVAADFRYRGLPVNECQINLRISSGSIVQVAPRRATFLGSISISEDAHCIRCHTSYGLKREWGIWNRHNQEPIVLKGGVPGKWYWGMHADLCIYSPEFAPALGRADAFVQPFVGRTSRILAKYQQAFWLQAGSVRSAVVQGGIGWGRAEGEPRGAWLQADIETGSVGFATAVVPAPAYFDNPEASGRTKVYPLLKTAGVSDSGVVNDGTSVVCAWGEELRMLLTAEWMG